VCIRETVSRVRIPHSPLKNLFKRIREFSEWIEEVPIAIGRKCEYGKPYRPVFFGTNPSLSDEEFIELELESCPIKFTVTVALPAPEKFLGSWVPCVLLQRVCPYQPLVNKQYAMFH
jgi:hypothetical protein